MVFKLLHVSYNGTYGPYGSTLVKIIACRNVVRSGAYV
jgi:hypothetical protein